MIDEKQHKKIIQAMRSLQKLGYDPEEIVAKWITDAKTCGDDAEIADMRLAINIFKTETGVR